MAMRKLSSGRSYLDENYLRFALGSCMFLMTRSFSGSSYLEEAYQYNTEERFSRSSR